MSKVLPILFNSDMVCTILEGRKTVTRRVIKFPVNSFTGRIPIADDVRVSTNTLWSKEVGFFEGAVTFDVKPPYGIGDILYVRETWNINNLFSEDDEEFYVIFEYKADGAYNTVKISGEVYEKYEESMAENMPEWRPSIHMPKQAARIWLKVTDVRVERLQEITIDGCEEEGCWSGHNGDIFAFMALWDSTIKKADRDRYGWNANPWVWVIEFERCEKPESEG